jgi:hypothetical protein
MKTWKWVGIIAIAALIYTQWDKIKGMLPSGAATAPLNTDGSPDTNDNPADTI